MSENERCERTDLLPAECHHCKTKEEEKTATFWDAKYEGICKHPSCLKVIDVGDRVKWTPDGGGVMHANHKER